MIREVCGSYATIALLCVAFLGCMHPLSSRVVCMCACVLSFLLACGILQGAYLLAFVSGKTEMETNDNA